MLSERGPGQSRHRFHNFGFLKSPDFQHSRIPDSRIEGNLEKFFSRTLEICKTFTLEIRKSGKLFFSEKTLSRPFMDYVGLDRILLLSSW